MTPGTAQTGRFQFSTATLCLAPMAQQKAIHPQLHSVGLIKNVKVDATPSKVDLTQGPMNDVVSTVVNGMPITVSGEVYEFTAKNLAYGLSLDPAAIVDMAAPVGITGAVAANATTATAAVATGLAIGDWGYLQDGLDDQVHVFKVTGVTGNVITFTGHPVPTGLSFSASARIGEFNKIDADPSKANNNFAARIIGVSVDSNVPVVLHFPKVRIMRGFSMGFSADNFGNMPFELTPMVPLPTDPGYDGDFKTRMSAFSR